MLDILSQAVINQRAAEIRQDINSVATLIGTVNSRLNNDWAERIKVGAERGIAYLDTKVSSRADGQHYTNTRAGKLDRLDNLDASISSRAAQITADDIRTRVIDCQNKNNAIKAKTDQLLKTPSGGSAGTISAGKSITVSGAGILRTLSCVNDSRGRITLKIDGKVIYNGILTNQCKANLAGGGIRYNSQLHISVNNFSGHLIYYAYTKGD